MPVLAFELDQSEYAAASLVRVFIRNVGVGPALDIRIKWLPTKIGNDSPPDQLPPASLIMRPGDDYTLELRPNAVDLAISWALRQAIDGTTAIGEILVDYIDVYKRRASSTTTLVWTDDPFRGWYRTHVRLEHTELRLSSDA